MTDRLRSGNEALDGILGGGLPAHGISLITGLPGSGKTIIAQQYLFQNAHPERPGVYLSTVSEPLEKILRFGETLDFFDSSAVGRSVFYEDLGETLSNHGLPGALERIGGLLRERRPGIIVIDSFRALAAFADGHGDFRKFLHELAGRLTAMPVASLWVGEYEESEIGSMPEFAVADAIIGLATVMTGHRETRLLRIRKVRGSGFQSGWHTYRLSSGGLRLFPRLADTAVQPDYSLGDLRVSSGIAALDEMLADGYWPGASTLVLGPSGSGKTIMGLHYIFGGARQGEPGVIATLQENPSQLQRMASGFGWAASVPGVELMYRSPVDVYIDEWVYDLLDTVERTSARRVLVDSLMDLQLASPDETRFREFMYSLGQRFSRSGVSMLMTLETPGLFSTGRLSDLAMSHLSDNVIALGHYLHHGSLKRSMAVVKTRASRHEPTVREFLIGPEGLTLGGRVQPDEILAGG